MTRLTARQVQTLRKPGRYSDGHGLHLFVQRSGTRSWVQRLTVPGRGRVDRGLGSVDVVSLAQARAWALDNKLAVKRSEDPFAGPQRSTMPTLRKIAGKVADSNRARLSPGEHKARAAALERHAADLLDLPVDRVGKPEVLRALERVWTSQPGTGRKLRTALGALFRHARAAGLIEVDPVAAVAAPARRRRRVGLPESAGGVRLVVSGDRGRGHEVGRSRRRWVASRLALDVTHVGIGARGRGLRGDGNESVACGRLGCRTELFAVDFSGQAPGTAQRMVRVPCR